MSGFPYAIAGTAHAPPGLPTKPGGRRSLKRFSPLLISVVTHLAVLALAIGFAAKPHVTPRRGDSVAVTLVSAASAPAGAEQPATDAASRFADSQRQAMAADTAPAVADPARPHANLDELLGEPNSGASTPSRAASPRGGGRGSPAAPAATPDPDVWARASFIRPSLGGGVNADLWRQVARCWRRPASFGGDAVTVEVALDADGELAAPPRVLPPASGPGGGYRRTAEALALQALAACAPYRQVGATYQVVFKSG